MGWLWRDAKTRRRKGGNQIPGQPSSDGEGVEKAKPGSVGARELQCQPNAFSHRLTPPPSSLPTGLTEQRPVYSAEPQLPAALLQGSGSYSGI